MNKVRYPTPWRRKQVSGDAQPEIRTHIDVFRSAIILTPQKQPWKRAAAVLIAVVVLAVIGFGGDWLFSGSKAAPPHNASVSTVAHVVTSSGNKSATSTATQSYTSSDFNLSFKYPDGWKVVDNGNGPMTVTSPSMQLNSASNKLVTGLITMTIQQQGQLPARFSAGTALAVLNSQRITYAQPTTDQPSQAYLSFVQYSATTTKGGLDGVYLTGNYGYQKDQAIPSADIASISPLVTVTFTKCGNASCTVNLVPLTIASTSWSKGTLQAPIKAMLASLAFQ